jgi:predicted transglutaminase-like cysteine proteinase
MFLFVQLKDKILSFRLHHLILILLLSLATCAWGLTLSNQLLNYISQKYGDAAEKRMQHWQQLMSSNKKLTTQQKLDEVNRFFNQVTFLSDLQHWGKIDYWATPIELLVTNGGDCEDYSIAKYFTLREMGIPITK